MRNPPKRREQLRQTNASLITRTPLKKTQQSSRRRDFFKVVPSVRTQKRGEKITKTHGTNTTHTNFMLHTMMKRIRRARPRDRETREIVDDFERVAQTLETLSGHEYHNYVVTSVLPDPLLRTFYLHVPMDRYLMNLAVTMEQTDANVYGFLKMLCLHGACARRVVAAIGVCMTSVVARTKHLEDMCAFLRYAFDQLELDDAVMLLDEALWFGLARRVTTNTTGLIASVVAAAWNALRKNPDLLTPLAQAFARRLPTAKGTGEGHVSSGVLRRIVESHDPTRALIARHYAVALARSIALYPSSDVVGVMAALTRGPSVDVMLRLHRTKSLDSMIASMTGEEGAIIGEKNAIELVTNLRRQWPAMMANNDSDVDLKERVGSSEMTCPITLTGMHNPVMASDGRMYERDAIMQHFSTSGLTSPVTRQPVSDLLFAAYAMS